MKDLEQARAEINEVDEQIAALFQRRMEAVRAVAAYKTAHGLPVLDAAREAAVIERGAARVQDPALRPYYVSVIRNMMEVSKQYQHFLMNGARVAYSGVEGAFAHIAASRIFPDAEKRAYADFAAAYAAAETGACDCAVLPIENSFAGEVGQVLDLAFRGTLTISGVYNLRVAQHLLGVKGAHRGDIRTVVSHPQALSQCEGYIRRHGYTAEQCSNTARAAQSVAERNDPTVAAIASAETAALYGLSVLDHDINENAGNTTRFAVFTRMAPEPPRSKNSVFLLLFTVNNVAGALAKAINVIGAHGFNMRVLRSRPLKDHAWQYYFYVEAEGDETTEEGQAMMRDLAPHCDLLKVVGHYIPDVTLGEEG